MEEFTEKDLKQLKAQKKIIEMNLAMSGVEGEKLQKLAHLMVQERLNILDDLGNQNINEKRIGEELQEFLEDQVEKKIQKRNELNEKMQFLQNQHQEDIKYWEQDTKDNKDQINEQLEKQAVEFKELKQDLKFIMSSIKKKPISKNKKQTIY